MWLENRILLKKQGITNLSCTGNKLRLCLMAYVCSRLHKNNWVKTFIIKLSCPCVKFPQYFGLIAVFGGLVLQFKHQTC